ncbi:MAG: TrkH family potassium uptake protein [Candidatus Eiseniibacteriota bacterium]|jgi:trk system potassium uptake protein TrkH
MRLYLVFRYVGLVLLLDTAMLLVSAGVSAMSHDSATFPLLYSALIAGLFGAFPLVFVPPADDISSMEGMAIVVISWLLSCLAGMLPFGLWGGEFTATNAWFESVSGFTTTGSTILSDLDALPRGLLFWRSSTHWIGGIGIIIFALALLPSLGAAGAVLYRSEISPLAAESFRQRTRRTLKILLVTYVGLTASETALLLVCGMGPFDAVTHAFATIATGGFSPHATSIAYFHSAWIEGVIIVFMVLSGMHFGLLFAAARGQPGHLLRSTATRYYLAGLVCAALAVTASIHGPVTGDWWSAFRLATFQVISVGTSTGFATADSSHWPPFAVLVLLFFTLQCACSGSTSGGIKVDRMVIAWKALIRRVTLTRYPRAVVNAKLDGSTIADDTIEAALLYIVLYIGIVFASSVILSALGVDALTAFSGSAAAMGNVGPGFGAVGSMSHFGGLPEAARWVLSADMILGRLEVFGLVAILFGRSWY